MLHMFPKLTLAASGRWRNRLSRCRATTARVIGSAMT